MAYLNDSGRQTGGGGGFAGGVHCPRHKVDHILEKLAFGCAWITDDAHVDITPKTSSHINVV
jgi:hypothetical protein